MSLSSLLSIARSALQIHQRAMTVTGNNVANAQTPGYSRQRLELVEASPQWTPMGMVGRGVDATTISRARDRFYDASFRRESGLLGNASERASTLLQLDNTLSEPSELGLGAALDELFSKFTDLSNDASNGTKRSLARQSAMRLVDQFHQVNARLGQLASDSRARLADQVAKVNQLTQTVAALNKQILAAGPQGAPTLEDQRDLAIDQLSSMMSIQVVEHPDGTVAVETGGALLVDAAQSRDLEVKSPGGGGVAVGFVSDPGTIDVGGGSIKALVDLAGTTLPDYQTQLDRLASNMVSIVNATHRAGFTRTGATGVDFFDPAGATAGTISLSASVAASADAIAAGDTPGSGDGSNAQRLGDLSRVPLLGLGNRTMREYYVSLTSTIGVAASDATQQEMIEQTMVDNSDAQRQQVSGVSVDEEMVDLLAQQQAYGAAARLVTVANDMMQTLLQI